MIKLNKIGEPKVITDNADKWTKNILEKTSAGLEISEAEKSRYRHSDIKNAVVEETSDKCAYCESKIGHVAFGDIEHVHPKSKSPYNLFRWDNLTLACDKCNTYKGDDEDIVDPYSCDPEDRFRFLGPFMIAKFDDDQATHTEVKLKLNRHQLIERRTERIKGIANQLKVLYLTVNPTLKEVLREDIINNETKSEKEFSAASRAFIKAMLSKQASLDLRPDET